jgi:amino acid transporter
MPATLAILSIVFVESIYSAAGVVGQEANIVHKLLSVAVIAIISLANSISTKASTRLNGFFVYTKFFTISFVVLSAVAAVVLFVFAEKDDQLDWHRRNWFAPRDSSNADGSITHWEGLGAWETLGHLSAALYGALWAYSGWDKV